MCPVLSARTHPHPAPAGLAERGRLHLLPTSRLNFQTTGKFSTMWYLAGRMPPSTGGLYDYDMMPQ